MTKSTQSRKYLTAKILTFTVFQLVSIHRLLVRILYFFVHAVFNLNMISFFNIDRRQEIGPEGITNLHLVNNKLSKM